MTRRALLHFLAAGMTLDPERLLWRPGAKRIFVPPSPRVAPFPPPWYVEAMERELLRFIESHFRFVRRIVEEDGRERLVPVHNRRHRGEVVSFSPPGRSARSVQVDDPSRASSPGARILAP